MLLRGPKMVRVKVSGPFIKKGYEQFLLCTLQQTFEMNKIHILNIKSNYVYQAYPLGENKFQTCLVKFMACGTSSEAMKNCGFKCTEE